MEKKKMKKRKNLLVKIKKVKKNEEDNFKLQYPIVDKEPKKNRKNFG